MSTECQALAAEAELLVPPLGLPWQAQVPLWQGQVRQALEPPAQLWLQL